MIYRGIQNYFYDQKYDFLYGQNIDDVIEILKRDIQNSLNINRDLYTFDQTGKYDLRDLLCNIYMNALFNVYGLYGDGHSELFLFFYNAGDQDKLKFDYKKNDEFEMFDKRFMEYIRSKKIDYILL